MPLNINLPPPLSQFSGLRTIKEIVNEEITTLVGIWRGSDAVDNSEVEILKPYLGSQNLTQTIEGRMPTAKKGVIEFDDNDGLSSGAVFTIGESVTIGIKFRITDLNNDVQNILGGPSGSRVVFRILPEGNLRIGDINPIPLTDTNWHSLILITSETEEIVIFDGAEYSAPRIGGWGDNHFRVGNHVERPITNSLIGEISSIVAMKGTPSNSQKELLAKILE